MKIFLGNIENNIEDILKLCYREYSSKNRILLLFAMF